MVESNPDDGLVKVSKFLAKAIAGLAPGGGTLAEIIELVVGNPADRRRDRFLIEVAERLASLEAANKIDILELASDERVSTILLQAIQAATRAQSDNKRQALRDASIGGVCIDSNRALASVVISILDDLTDLHLYVLEELADVTRRLSWGKVGYTEASTFFHHLLQKAYGTSQAISEGYAKTHEKLPNVPDPESEEYRIIFADLVRSGLVHDQIDGNDVLERRQVGLTPLGSLTLRYILEGHELLTEVGSS